MKTLPLSIALIFYVSIQLNAQIAQLSFNPASALSLANANTAIQDKTALYNNPAGLTPLKQTQFLINSMWLYGMKDLAPISAGCIVPSKSGVLGFSMQYWRFDNIRETNWSINYGRKISSKMNIGARMTWINSHLTNEIIDNKINLSLGVNTLIINNLRLGILLNNPFNIIRQKSQDAVQMTQMRLGLAYNFTEKFVLSSDFKKAFGLKSTFSMGMAFTPINQLSIKTGFETNPIRLAFGFDFKMTDKICFDLALSQHTTLGATPALGLNYIF